MKLREIFYERCKDAGYVDVQTRSDKYIVMSHPDPQVSWFLFIGKSGSLRFSRSRAIGGSIPYSSRIRERIVDEPDWSKTFLAAMR
jgi:hypothetical protein